MNGADHGAHWPGPLPSLTCAMLMTRPLTVLRVTLAAATLVGTNAAAQGDTTPPSDTTAPPAATSTKIATDSVLAVDVTPDQGQELRPVLKSEVAKAVALGRTPFVEVGATWCEPCQELKANLGDPRMIKAFAGTYIIRLDADQWSRDQRLPLGLASGYLPTFFAIDKTGKSTGKQLIPKGATDPGKMAPQLSKFFRANRWKKS